ncbi:MAG: Uma2 family endonuclease [Caloramator sp.]|nr:Uma2 family endonuclease [Caloramator sp.]
MGEAAKKQERLTYKDYLTWKDDFRWEIINGIAYCLAPSPSSLHQLISGRIFGYIFNYLADKECLVFAAPFDVRIPLKGEKDEDIENVLQPDISVICDKKKIDKRGCLGAPDMVVEILSPATRKIDLQDKYFLYEKAGVKEYWIVDPINKTVSVHILGEDKSFKRASYYTSSDKIRVSIFEDLVIDLEKIFAGIEDIEY